MSRKKDIAKEIAKEVERIEREDDLEESTGEYVRSKRPPTDPSQVYSVRIPVDRLEQLRLVAVDRGVAPSTLIREWVLERLDEVAAAKNTDPHVLDLTKALKRAMEEALPEVIKTATSRTERKRGKRRTAS